MKKVILHHEEVPATADLSQVVKVGPLVYLSGQIGITSNGTMISQDPEEQIVQTFSNLKKLLKQAGGGLENVVKITSYLTNREYLPIYVRIRRQFFSEPFPASTMIIAQLASPEYIYELDAIAILENEDIEIKS